MREALLQADNITKIFEGKTRVEALRSIDLAINQGEYVAILGPSGCGKTTLLRIFAGLTKPTTGKCTFLGEEINKPNRQRALVFQDPRLFPWLTVRGNIELAIKKQAFIEANERIVELCKKMQLSEFMYSYPHELSGGMAKRVALARALAGDPKLLLLDEPLAHLDKNIQLSLLNELHRLWKDGLTSVLVTHDVDEALMLATRIIILSARPAQIIANQQISLPFPRDPLDGEFVQLKEKIMKINSGVGEPE